MKRSKTFIALSAVLLAFGLAACSSDGSGVPDAGGRAGGDSVAAEPFDSSAELDSSQLNSSLLGTEVASEERSIIHTGSLAVEVDSPGEAADQVSEIVSGLGGSVSSKSISHQGGAENAQLTVRVPAERLDDAFAQLGEVGTVLSEERSADDVTEMHVDLQARVAALESSVERLTELMEGAATTSELLEAESALSQRQQELDGLKAQLQSLEGQVAEASIWVTLSAPRVLPGGGPTNFWEALTTGFDSIGDFGRFAVIALGILLPWLVIAAVIAAAIVVPIRIRRRRRAAAAPLAEAIPAQRQPDQPNSEAKSTESVAEPPVS